MNAVTPQSQTPAQIPTSQSANAAAVPAPTQTPANDAKPQKTVSKKRPAANRPAANRNDQEFLPAALEILETPPSPVRMALLTLICVFVALALVWSWIGTIDIFATATGKIQPTGRVKIVQPLETGRVATLNVKNGGHVKSGDVVVTQVSDEAETDRAAITSSLASSEGEVIRRKTSIRLLTETPAANLSERPVEDLIKAVHIEWPANIPPNIREREELVLVSTISQLHSALSSLVAQRNQKQAELARLTETAKAENSLIASLKERTDMREKMVDAAAGSRATLLDTLATLQTQEAVLATELGQIEEAKAGISVLNAEIDKTKSGYLSDDTQKILEAERHVDELQEQLEKANEKLAHMTLASPISGTIQSLSVTTIGQVVTSGQELMRIIPEDSTLEVTAFLENKDIGFVHEGQEAVIKIESFPLPDF